MSQSAGDDLAASKDSLDVVAATATEIEPTANGIPDDLAAEADSLVANENSPAAFVAKNTPPIPKKNSAMSSAKLPPHSREAEQSEIGRAHV